MITFKAMKILPATKMLDSSGSSSKVRPAQHDQIRLLSQLFRESGWKVDIQPRLGHREADLLISRRNLRYAVLLKIASETRRDRIIPLLSQAILEADAVARSSPQTTRPLAIVAVPEISPSVSRSVQAFLVENAPQASVGLLDRQGSRTFWQEEFEDLNKSTPRQLARDSYASSEPANLFSDLNQWMLKVLLAPMVSPELLRAPRGSYRNASELATAADVSVASAFRFVRQLEQEGFLNEQTDRLRLVRCPKLMKLWQGSHRRSQREIRLRWLFPGDGRATLMSALHRYGDFQVNTPNVMPRVCLSFFTAAEELGVGFVHGALPSIYLEKLVPNAWKKMGLSSEGTDHAPGVLVRVPSFRESLFRAAVRRQGIPTADVIQTWLDVSHHPTRGKEQAEQICRRVLKPIFDGEC